MKVHANAPLGPKGRGIMVLRVLEQGWSLSGGRGGGRSERAHLLEVGQALPGRGGGRPVRSLFGAEVDPAPHTGRARRSDRAAA